LITALCESGYCETAKPFYKAADFDIYFIQHGWKQISLETLKQKAIAHESMDVVFQKSGVTASRPGHVIVFVDYHSNNGQYLVAEGSLGTETNAVEEVSEKFLSSWNGGFTVFIRQ
jgi:hypothetical protein